MKLVASLVVRNELHRYITQTVPHLLTFCDELRVLDDNSDDGTFEWLRSKNRVEVTRNPGPSWEQHEGRTRQALLDWTLEGNPSRVLCIDADEFVSDGQRLRERLSDSEAEVWTLRIVEVWGTDPWFIRTDGGWRPHPIPCIYSPQPGYHMQDRQLACGREPVQVREAYLQGRAEAIDVDLLHMGWAKVEEREGRAERYRRLDGGNFHAGSHLDSILWGPDRVTLQPYPAPW